MESNCAWRQGTAPMNPMLLQHTLRGLCSNESRWVYAVFWRILPRNYPPPQWDTEGGMMDRSKGNKRNWILVWEDGFCNFSACSSTTSASSGSSSSSFRLSGRREPEPSVEPGELSMNPELFFKMSHEVYNYGEGLMGKVAVDNSHKWVCREPLENDLGFLSSPWQNSIDPHPRTWEGQFKAGIQTIAVVAVQEGVLQLGSTQKMMEDLNFVLYMQRKFSFLHSIPGVLVPHPASRGKQESFNAFARGSIDQFLAGAPAKRPPPPSPESVIINTSGPVECSTSNGNGHGYGYPKAAPPLQTTFLPSMSSLQALLSKLPSVTGPVQNNSAYEPPILIEGDSMMQPRLNHNNNNINNTSMFDSLDNFSEFGIQDALESGDSSYTLFLNEICS